jgi:hypothetical protein
MMLCCCFCCGHAAGKRAAHPAVWLMHDERRSTRVIVRPRIYSLINKTRSNVKTYSELNNSAAPTLKGFFDSLLFSTSCVWLIINSRRGVTLCQQPRCYFGIGPLRPTSLIIREIGFCRNTYVLFLSGAESTRTLIFLSACAAQVPRAVEIIALSSAFSIQCLSVGLI